MSTTGESNGTDGQSIAQGQKASIDRGTAGSGRKAKVGDQLPKEIGGQEGPEPTRYGDWEKNGRCTDF